MSGNTTPSRAPKHSPEHSPATAAAPDETDPALSGRDTTTLPFSPAAIRAAAAPVTTSASITTLPAGAGAGAPTESAACFNFQIEVNWGGPKLIFTPQGLSTIDTLKQYLAANLPESAQIILTDRSRNQWSADFARLWRVKKTGALELSFLGKPEKDEIMSIVDPILALVLSPLDDTAPLVAPDLTLDSLEKDSPQFIKLLPDELTITPILALAAISSFLDTAGQIQTIRNDLNKITDDPYHEDTYELQNPTKRTRRLESTCLGFGVVSSTPFAAGGGVGVAAPPPGGGTSATATGGAARGATHTHTHTHTQTPSATQTTPRF